MDGMNEIQTGEQNANTQTQQTNTQTNNINTDTQTNNITQANGRTKCERYSRIVGYLRPLQQWNKGKQAEWVDRKTFVFGKCVNSKQ